MCFVPQQIYKFEALLPPVVKKKEKKPAEARPKKKPRVETETMKRVPKWMMGEGNPRESLARYVFVKLAVNHGN